jgi:epoxyqueuosine reductase
MSEHEIKLWVKNVIRDFIENSPENSLKGATGEKAWEDCLIGFSNGADSIFQEYKEHVGSFHMTPLELFTKSFPETEHKADQLTVISWILPQTDQTKSDNRKQTAYPAERWARARIFGEQTNAALRDHVVATLQGQGYQAIAPQLSPYWKRKTSDKFGFASTWSERHAAYASGLGTFGLCDGLITPKGKAMRCGSVIADIQIPPTVRPYQDHHEYCLFFTEGICKRCIPRCPAGAISEQGHDKIKCRGYMFPMINEYVKAHYHFDGYGCGLCQTGVPCESKIPTAKDVK